MIRVAIDVDSVIIEISKPWLRLYNAEFNDAMTESDWIKWGIHELVKPECGTQIYKYIDVLYDEPDCLPIDFALKGVETLQQFCDVKLVTSGLTQGKINWLKRYGFSEKDIIMTNDKNWIDANLLIDDALHNVQGWGRFVLFDKPWNQGVEVKYRAKSWSEILWMAGKATNATYF